MFDRNRPFNDLPPLPPSTELESTWCDASTRCTSLPHAGAEPAGAEGDAP